MSDGTVRVYQGTTLLGQVPLPATAAWTGRIGVRFNNTGTGTPAANETRFDNFGGGNVAFATPRLPPEHLRSRARQDPYQPANTLPAAADHAIQNAIDAAAASSGNDLVVVYPGPAQTPSNSRPAPARCVSYENLILNAPVKLQGVGAGRLPGLDLGARHDHRR